MKCGWRPESHLCLHEHSNADNPDPEMVVPSSALLDPWNDSYSGESRKVMEDQEEREPNQLQRRLGQRIGGSLNFDLKIIFFEFPFKNSLLLC